MILDLTSVSLAQVVGLTREVLYAAEPVPYWL